MMPWEQSEVMLSSFLDTLLSARMSINGDTEVDSKGFDIIRKSWNIHSIFYPLHRPTLVKTKRANNHNSILLDASSND